MRPLAPAASILTPELAATLGGDGPALGAEELTHNAGNQATGGIWRVAGPAGSAVLKLATAAGGGHPAWATSDQGHHWNSWRREVLAYQSGFAPRLSRRWLRQYVASKPVADPVPWDHPAAAAVWPAEARAGLRAGGWSGRDAQVRRAIAVTGAAKYCWPAPLMLQLLAAWGGLALGEGAG